MIDDYLDILNEVNDGGYNLNDWEQEFVFDNLDAERLSFLQREAIRRLDLKYLKKG